jgi:hypothetical protein
MPVTVCLAKNKRPKHICSEKQKHIQLWTVSRMFSNFMRIVAPPNSQVMLVNISQYMECDFITEDNFGCKNFVVFKSWKKVRAKCVVNFSVLGSYMLQQLVLKIWNFKRFSAEFCALLCVAQTVSTWASVTGRLLGLFLDKCSHSDQTVYTTWKSTFMLAVPFQTPYEISFTL